MKPTFAQSAIPTPQVLLTEQEKTIFRALFAWNMVKCCCCCNGGGTGGGTVTPPQPVATVDWELVDTATGLAVSDGSTPVTDLHYDWDEVDTGNGAVLASGSSPWTDRSQNIETFNF